MDGIGRGVHGEGNDPGQCVSRPVSASLAGIAFPECQAALTKAQDGSDSPVPQPVPSSSPAVDPASSPSEVDAQARVDSSISEVIADSLIGPLRPELWRPLGFMGLLSEGWDESYAPAPGDAPRQTWINNADGASTGSLFFPSVSPEDCRGTPTHITAAILCSHRSAAPVFKNFVYELSANLHTQINGGKSTYFSLTPGLRFGVGRDWYLLAGLEVPVSWPTAVHNSNHRPGDQELLTRVASS